MGIEYDRRSGQYRGTDGRYIGRSRVEALVQGDLVQTQAVMRDLTSQLIEYTIDLETWQRSIAQTLKESHIRMGLLASGGLNNATSKDYGLMGSEIKKQYQYLDRFAKSIENGELSIEQVLARVSQYSRSARVTFHIVELKNRQDEGFGRGRRLLDFQSNHCPKCLEHHRPDWVSLSDIIAPGTDCDCRVNCKCRVLYSRF